MNTQWKKLTLGIASAGVLTLYGCGGGSSGGVPSTGVSGSPPALTATTDVPVTVIDGPIQNATVCLDKNANGICDADEPKGRTDSAGKTTLKVDTADVGKFAVLAVVGTDAVDMDRPTTPITTPFTMTAPADKPAVISPLTTLVQTLVQNAGLNSTAAAAQLKEQTGLNVSLFEDFTASKTAANETAGTLARVLVVTAQQKTDAIKSTVGTTAIDGTTITASDIDKLVQARLIEVLSNILAVLSNPTVAAATTPAAKEAAIQTQTTALLAEPSNATSTASVATLVGVANVAAAPQTAVVSTPASFLTLRALTFTDASNWFVRTFTGTAQQNTIDSAGNFRYVHRRSTSVAGQVANWGVGSNPARQADLHFNGTAWVNCPLNNESTSTVRDAQGNSTFNFCNGRETGTSNRADFDVSGRTMASVYQQVRDAGYTDLTIANAATALGTTAFGTGAKLQYSTITPLTSANSYYPGTGSIVKQYSAALSAGGVASSQAANTGCNAPEQFASPTREPATLETVMATATGNPCVYTGGTFVYASTTFTNPDARNEWWGNSSTIEVGKVGTAPVGTGPAPGFYTANRILKVAFKGTGTNPVTYYSCKQRFNNGSNRNCDVIGTGSYTITTQGDARSLTYNNMPVAFSSLSYQQVLVERGGKVFFGYKNNLTVSTSARLNTVAAAALFTQLGLPAVNPDVPVTLTRASYQGIWDISSIEFPLQKSVLTISNLGATSCIDTDNSVTPPITTTQACVITFTDLVTGAFTASTPGNTGSATGTLNFLTGVFNGRVVDGSFTETLVGARR